MKMFMFTKSLILLLIIFNSCNFSNNTTENVSLLELKKTVKTEEEKIFLENAEIIDNSSLAKEALGKKDALTLFKAKIRFKHGKNCDEPIGLCIIIPFVVDAFNAEITIYKNHLIIYPTTKENGLTLDNYLPVFKNVELDNELCEKLKIDPEIKIKPAIYQTLNIKNKVCIVLDLNKSPK